MTRALLFSLTSSRDASLPSALVEIDGRPAAVRLIAQLRAIGVGSITVVTRPGWREELVAALDADVVEAPTLSAAIGEVARAASDRRGELVMAHADVVVSTGALRALVEDPRVPTGILAASGDVEGPAFSVRTSRERVVAASSPFHSLATGHERFLGTMVVADQDRSALARVARELGSIVDAGRPEAWAAELDRNRTWWAAAGGDIDELDRDPLALVLVGLVRRDVRVGRAPLRGYVWQRPRDRSGSAVVGARLERVDDDALRLEAAVKPQDGFFTTFLVSPYSKYLARWAARHGFSPNQVTLASLLVALAAAGSFAWTGGRPGWIAGALLLQLSFTLDCVDGQLARYTFAFSTFGGWLDGVSDRVKEYVVYAGLAAGAGQESIWLLAMIALTVQVVRHHVDLGYAAQHETSMDERLYLPLERSDEPEITALEAPPSDARGGGGAGAIVRAAHRVGERAALSWAKRIVTLPIGERFALISVTVVLGGPTLTFVALITWGIVALGYVTAGRLARALA